MPWGKCIEGRGSGRQNIKRSKVTRSIAFTCRGSLRRLGRPSLALGQLHWSVAKYAPPLERALWDGLAAMYDEACFLLDTYFFSFYLTGMYNHRHVPCIVY